MPKPKAETTANETLIRDHSRASPPDRFSILWYLAIVPSFWSFGFTVIYGSDLWWHLATGRWILAHRALPLTDSWSFTRAGQPWLQHEWLSDVLFQLWVNTFGMNSLVYWKWSMVVFTFLMLFHVARRLTHHSLASYVAVLLALATAAPFLDIRPHLYSALGYVLLLCLTVLRDRPPIYLPLVFLVWVNLHGGFFFGLMALSVLLLPSIISSRFADRRRSVTLWVASVLICLFNPNGISAFTYPLRYAFDRTSPFAQAIAEWQSPFVAGGIRSPLYLYAIGAFLVASAFLLLKRGYREQKSIGPALALSLLTLAMSLASRRFIVLFAISQSLIVAPALAAVIPVGVHRISRLAAPAAVAVLGFVWLLPYPVSPYAFHYLTVEDEFPIETCNFIEANQLSGNVFSYYNWGGYLHLRTDGRMKVYIDGRADTVYDDQTMVRYAAVQGFRSGWEEIIEGSGAQYILWPRSEQGKPLAQLVSSGRWRILYDDFASVLLVRSDQQLAAALKPTPDSAYRRATDGVKNLEQGRFEDAERSFRSALELMPHLRLACDSLARSLALQGKKQEALQTLEQCQRTFPDRKRENSVRALLQ